MSIWLPLEAVCTNSNITCIKKNREKYLVVSLVLVSIVPSHGLVRSTLYISLYVIICGGLKHCNWVQFWGRLVLLVVALYSTTSTPLHFCFLLHYNWQIGTSSFWEYDFIVKNDLLWWSYTQICLENTINYQKWSLSQPAWLLNKRKQWLVTFHISMSCLRFHQWEISPLFHTLGVKIMHFFTRKEIRKKIYIPEVVFFSFNYLRFMLWSTRGDQSLGWESLDKIS